MKASNLVFSFTLLSALAMTISANVFAAAIDELNASDQEKVKNGEQVLVLHDVSGSSWPQMVVYQQVAATPEEATAVLWDFNLQQTYVPHLTKSQISKVDDKATVEVDYSINAPVVGAQNYTAKNHISTYDSAASYEIVWTQVSSDFAKRTEGMARFEGLGTGTLMVYTTLIVPKSIFAGMLKDKMIAGVQDTVQAVSTQIQGERIKNRILLEQQIAKLREATQ